MNDVVYGNATANYDPSDSADIVAAMLIPDTYIIEVDPVDVGPEVTSPAGLSAAAFPPLQNVINQLLKEGYNA